MSFVCSLVCVYVTRVNAVSQDDLFRYLFIYAQRHFMNRLKMCCRTLSLRFSSRSVMCNTEKHIIIIIIIIIMIIIICH